MARYEMAPHAHVAGHEKHAGQNYSRPGPDDPGGTLREA